MKTVPATGTLEAAVTRFPGEVSVSRGGFAQAAAGASPPAHPTNSDVVTPAAATPLRIDPPPGANGAHRLEKEGMTQEADLWPTEPEFEPCLQPAAMSGDSSVHLRTFRACDKTPH